MPGMERLITASLLARRLGDILGRVRYAGETFLVERHNVPVARIGPANTDPRTTRRSRTRVDDGNGR